MTKQEQIEEMGQIIVNNGCDLLKSVNALYDVGYRKIENVYTIVSSEGGLSLNIFTGKGMVYADKEKAEATLRRINEWSKIKGYGMYELVELEVEQ